MAFTETRRFMLLVLCVSATIANAYDVLDLSAGAAPTCGDILEGKNSNKGMMLANQYCPKKCKDAAAPRCCAMGTSTGRCMAACDKQELDLAACSHRGIAPVNGLHPDGGSISAVDCFSCVNQGFTFCSGSDFFSIPSVCVDNNVIGIYRTGFKGCNYHSFGSSARKSSLDCTFKSENGAGVLAAIIICPIIVIIICLCCWRRLKRDRECLCWSAGWLCWTVDDDEQPHLPQPMVQPAPQPAPHLVPQQAVPSHVSVPMALPVENETSIPMAVENETSIPMADVELATVATT